LRGHVDGRKVFGLLVDFGLVGDVLAWPMSATSRRSMSRQLCKYALYLNESGVLRRDNKRECGLIMCNRLELAPNFSASAPKVSYPWSY
jgi:hypothetical protein